FGLASGQSYIRQDTNCHSGITRCYETETRFTAAAEAARSSCIARRRTSVAPRMPSAPTRIAHCTPTGELPTAKFQRVMKYTTDKTTTQMASTKCQYMAHTPIRC